MNFSKQSGSKKMYRFYQICCVHCLDDLQFTRIFHKQSGSEINVKAGSRYGSEKKFRIHNTASSFVLAALSRQSYPGSPFLAVQSWQACSTSPVLPVTFCLSHSACPVLPALFYLSCSDCLFCLFRSGCPVLCISIYLSCLPVLF